MKDVVDPSKVKITGPGLSSGIRAHILQSFTVDSSKAGLAPLEVRVLGPRGKYASCLAADIDLPQVGAALPRAGTSLLSLVMNVNFLNNFLAPYSDLNS